MRSEHDAHLALLAGIQGTGRQLTERRQSVRETIDYYEHQARLADRGLTQRRSAEFLRRQAAYLRTENR